MHKHPQPFLDSRHSLPSLIELTQQNPISPEEFLLAKQYLLKNIATKDNVFTKVEGDKVYASKPGAVIASPSRMNSHFSQDYVFHWVRDAAIVINELAYLYEDSSDEAERQLLLDHFINYIEWSQNAQQQPEINNINVLGEPKYNIDGSVWAGEWSRPQNDGPALRAISLIHIANILIKLGQKEYVIERLFNTHLATDKMGIIKTDLEYIANHWNFETAGLWEEIIGYHFFTELVQRRALINGAELAREIGDQDAAHYYENQARHIEALIRSHWNDSTGYYAETLQHHHFKGGGINSAIILGILYGGILTDIDMLAVDDAKVISSAYYIRNAFEGLYQINLRDEIHCNSGPLIGRYPNDTYDGNRSIYGNPWILTTCIYAKYYYLLAETLFKKRRIEISTLTFPFFRQVCHELNIKRDCILTAESNHRNFMHIITSLLQSGDSMLHAVKQHSITDENGELFHLSEQIDRASGEQVSAKDLTWSYSTILAAYRRRRLLICALKE